MKRLAYSLAALIGAGTLALAYYAFWNHAAVDGNAVAGTITLNTILGYALWAWGFFRD